MTRAELISKGKIWQVYYDKTPDDILFEGNKTNCIKFLKQNNLFKYQKKGKSDSIGIPRLGKLI